MYLSDHGIVANAVVLSFASSVLDLIENDVEESLYYQLECVQLYHSLQFIAQVILTLTDFLGFLSRFH